MSLGEVEHAIWTIADLMNDEQKRTWTEKNGTKELWNVMNCLVEYHRLLTEKEILKSFRKRAEREKADA